ncbi:MAG: hypothetical protein JKY59_01485 [Emcibacter sp.]|nr:hypothetical protein [Emcibacter sp.]
MNGFTKLIMLVSTLVLMIGGGFSLYLTFQANQPIALTSANEEGIALEGFDTVSYHKRARPGAENQIFRSHGPGPYGILPALRTDRISQKTRNNMRPNTADMIPLVWPQAAQPNLPRQNFGRLTRENYTCSIPVKPAKCGRKTSQIT